jgi:sRNA-binding regulator protein Hfq
MLPKSKAPAQTFQEAAYLESLSKSHTRVHVKLVDNAEYEGIIEFWDQDFFRLTREDGPNLFVFKHDVKYFYEVPR